MNTLNKIQLVLYLLIFCVMSVYGQAKPQPRSETPKLTRSVIETSLNSMSAMIINGYPEKGGSDSKVISSLLLSEYEGKYKFYHGLPEIEKLTENSREWFGKLLKIVGELNKCSININNAIVRLQTDRLETLKKQYEDLRKIYKETYENPEKIKPKK